MEIRHTDIILLKSRLAGNLFDRKEPCVTFQEITDRVNQHHRTQSTFPWTHTYKQTIFAQIY